MLFSLRWLLLYSGLISPLRCAVQATVSVCQGSDDYQRLRPEASARLVLGFSMPIAWPAVADGVVQGSAPNRAFSVRPAATVATWLLMVVAVIVWIPGIGIFAYVSTVGHKYAFGKRVGGINFADFAEAGRIGTERRLASGDWRRRRGGGKGGRAQCRG